MSDPFGCQWCGFIHKKPLACPRLKRVEFALDGTIVAVDFYDPMSLQLVTPIPSKLEPES